MFSPKWQATWKTSERFPASTFPILGLFLKTFFSLKLPRVNASFSHHAASVSRLRQLFCSPFIDYIDSLNAITSSCLSWWPNRKMAGKDKHNPYASIFEDKPSEHSFLSCKNYSCPRVPALPGPGRIFVWGLTTSWQEHTHPLQMLLWLVQWGLLIHPVDSTADIAALVLPLSKLLLTVNPNITAVSGTHYLINANNNPQTRCSY